ncbi:adenylyltransferase/cytidyltransferase family protein, partial [Candidatus Aenigmatarchaeota archaeon]
MKKVMVGGVFSTLHPGHEFFLRKARGFGDFLVVVIASDKTLIRKKGTIDRTAEQRRKAIEDLGIADKVVVG